MFKFLLPLLVIAAIFYMVGLNKLPLSDYDEADYATIIKEMVLNKEYLNLTNFNQPWFEKPPLYLWLASISVKIFGLNEMALRLPSVLSGIVTVALTFAIILETTGQPLTAFFGGLILILLPFFLAATRQVRLDVPVSAAMLSAVWFYIKGLKNPKFFLGIGVAAGIGFMLKSIIGFLAFPLLIIWSFFYKDWHWLKNKYFWLGLILLLLISAPWHIQQTIKFGSEFWNEYLGHHVFQRATQQILSGEVSKSYFASTLWNHSYPWSILLFIAIPFAIFFWKKNALKPNAKASLLSFLFILLLFISVKTGLISYFTPMYPFVAIFLAIVYKHIEELIKNHYLKITYYVLMVATIITGIFISGKEAFGRPAIYALDISKDEQAVGLYLADHHNQEPIYVFEWQHHRTLRYYSGKEVLPLELGSGSIDADPPFWLILPTQLLSDNSFLQTMPTPYSGEFITLVHFIKQ